MSTQTEQRPAERRPEPEERRPVAGVVVLVVLAALLVVGAEVALAPFTLLPTLVLMALAVAGMVTGSLKNVAGIAVVLVVLAVAALSVGYLTRGRGTARTDASPVVTTPTTLVPPALANTGDNPDWPALVRSIMAYDFWLKVHPDPALVPTIYAPDYRAVLPSGEVMTLASVQADTATLARGDLRYDPAPVETTAAVVTMQNRDANSASVFVRFNPRPGYRTVGRDGTVTQLPDEKGGAVIWRLVLGADGRWRLAGWKLP